MVAQRTLAPLTQVRILAGQFPRAAESGIRGDEPLPVGPLKLYDAVYRLRVGAWRVICLVDHADGRIEVGGIRRRSERTYRGIDDLFS